MEITMVRWLVKVLDKHFQALFQGYFFAQLQSWKSSVLFSEGIIFLKSDRTTATLPCKRVPADKYCDTV